MQEDISYEKLTIQLLDDWGLEVERYKVYGLPKYLKVYFYPIIWALKKEVEAVCKRLIKK